MGSVRTSAPHVILPLAIVAVGVLFLLDNLGSLDATSFIGTWWPSVIVLLGLSMLPGRTMGFFFPGVVILLGVVFQLKHLELLPGDAWSYLWPALVVLLGLSMLARRLRSAGDRCDGAAQDVSVDRLDLSATFSQAERRIRSDAFTGGRASCSFGETVLDLTGTRLAGGRALLNVDVSFGRLELRVPSSWRVATRVGTVAAEVKELRTPPEEGAAAGTLEVDGKVSFGSLEIR